jgi:hypothetical protein
MQGGQQRQEQEGEPLPRARTMKDEIGSQGLSRPGRARSGSQFQIWHALAPQRSRRITIRCPDAREMSRNRCFQRQRRDPRLAQNVQGLSIRALDQTPDCGPARAVLASMGAPSKKGRRSEYGC